MTVGLATGSIIAAPGATVSLSSLFTVTPGASNPQYLIVSGLDRNEYTASATGSTGTFSGGGHTTGFSSLGGDAFGAGIVFTYNAATGQYVNATYGNLSSVVLTASRDINRNESISLFAANNPSSLNQYANNPYALEQFTTYVGSVSVVTQASSGAPAQATPSSIASTAMSYVGQSWNMDGCWVLASDISARAGASLPLTSTSVNVPGVASGEWIVAYNGPAGQSGDWQSMVKAGEMVSFATSATSGHITTVVSGSGANTLLVDNITYVYSNGAIANAANDGAANDVTIAAPHAASQEFSQAVAGSVVIYELDTPTVTATASGPAFVASGARVSLSSLMTATDPANHSITQYQVYNSATDGAAADTFVVGGTPETAHSAASALTISASSFASTALQATATTGVDTLSVRAYNGTYWGDWQNLTVDVGVIPQQPAAPAPAASIASSVQPALDAASASGPSQGSNAGSPLAAPVLTNQTANPVWHSRQAVNFAIAANTFTDPQGLGMTYSAYEINGPALPWLHFDAATGTFSGHAKSNASGSFEVAVIATDSSGLSSAEAFNVTMAPTASRFAHAMAQMRSGAGAPGASVAPPPVDTIPALYKPIA